MDEKYWNYAADLLKVATETDDVSKCISYLKSRWKSRKGYLEPFFGEDGRICTVVDGYVTKSLLKSALEETRRIAAVIASTNPRYKPVIKNDGEDICRYIERLLDENFSEREFALNKMEEKISIPGSCDKFFPAGTKITKYIAAELTHNRYLYNSCHILGDYNFEDADTLANFAIDVVSQFIGLLRISQDKVYLSINPVDFLLTSWHCTWDSCHNLFDGEWRTASLAFICDSVSAIAFASQEESEVPSMDFVWPKKTWRQMIYFNKDIKGAFQGNEYPTRKMVYSKAARNMLAQTLAKVCGAESADFHYISYLSYSDEYYQSSEPRPSRKIGGVKSDDWISCDSPSVVIRLKDGGEYPQTNNFLPVASEGLPCVHCGRTRDDPYNHDNLICENCDYTVRCSECGYRIPSGDEIDIDGESYCYGCYEYLFTQCEICGKDIFADSDSTYYENVYDVSYESVPICSDCYDELVNCNECGILVKSDEAEYYNDDKLCPDCYEERMQQKSEKAKATF